MSVRIPFDAVAELGPAFKKYRKAVYVTQQYLHEKTGVALSTISAFENGKGQGSSLIHFASLLNAVGLLDRIDGIIPDVPGLDLERMWKRQNRNN
ncbi:MAG: helix-turn-helix transcriptional regulator [Bacteroidales bacterium]|nr:helix-turn-helix transcriptional regulator [Bacteroidales bacterium]MBQ9175218.1 helix-turn-helix transcriptional regulator [Bacteroidales bacterium]